MRGQGSSAKPCRRGRMRRIQKWISESRRDEKRIILKMKLKQILDIDISSKIKCQSKSILLNLVRHNHPTSQQTRFPLMTERRRRTWLVHQWRLWTAGMLIDSICIRPSAASEVTPPLQPNAIRRLLFSAILNKLLFRVDDCGERSVWNSGPRLPPFDSLIYRPKVSHPVSDSVHHLGSPSPSGSHFIVRYSSWTSLAKSCSLCIDRRSRELNDNDFCSPERVDIWWEIPQYILPFASPAATSGPDHIPQLRIQTLQPSV